MNQAPLSQDGRRRERAGIKPCPRYFLPRRPRTPFVSVSNASRETPASSRIVFTSSAIWGHILPVAELHPLVEDMELVEGRALVRCLEELDDARPVREEALGDGLPTDNVRIHGGGHRRNTHAPRRIESAGAGQISERARGRSPSGPKQPLSPPFEARQPPLHKQTASERSGLCPRNGA